MDKLEILLGFHTYPIPYKDDNRIEVDERIKHAYQKQELEMAILVHEVTTIMPLYTVNTSSHFGNKEISICSLLTFSHTKTQTIKAERY